MVQRWLHLSELGGDPWVLPIWAAVNQAAQRKNVAPVGEELGVLGLHVSTRLNFLPRIVRRVNIAVEKLHEAIRKRGPEHEFRKDDEGIAFDVDNDLKYELLVDLDSLLFELNSVCELMASLFELLHQHASKPMPKPEVGASIRSILSNAGEDPSWFVALDTNRNFFMHQGTPYVAIDLSDAPEKYDILIMKENIKTFLDTSKFVRLSEVNDIVLGFRRSRSILQGYLRGLFI